MGSLRFYRGVFFVAALYDLILGAAFLFFYPWAYGLMGIPLPTEPAYLAVLRQLLPASRRSRETRPSGIGSRAIPLGSPNINAARGWHKKSEPWGHLLLDCVRPRRSWKDWAYVRHDMVISWLSARGPI